MKNDTPRTDEALSLHYSEGDYFGEDTTKEAYEFARGLERELNLIGVWSPIETAPLDGRWILIHCEGVGDEYSPCLVARWSGAEWSGWETLDAQHYCATSWMPLPQPPKSGLV